MKTGTTHFNNIVERVYSLPLEFKEELKVLLEHNIADARREEISDSYKSAQKEQNSDKLKFTSSIKELKKML